MELPPKVANEILDTNTSDHIIHYFSCIPRGCRAYLCLAARQNCVSSSFSFFSPCRLENSANRLYYLVDPLLSNQYRVHWHIRRKGGVEEIYTTPRTSSFFIVKNKSERDSEMIFSMSQYTDSDVKYFTHILSNTGSNGMSTRQWSSLKTH
jgi:hypothetical protein